MKKRSLILTLILAFALSASACSGGSSSANETASEVAAEASSEAAESSVDETASTDAAMTGGFTIAEDATGAEIPQEVQDALDTALAGDEMMSYNPVVYLGSQELNGTSYEVLCKAAPADDESAITYEVVTVYGDSEIPFYIHSVADFDLGYYAYDAGSADEDDVADTTTDDAAAENSAETSMVEAAAEDSAETSMVEVTADTDSEWIPYTTQNAEAIPEEVNTAFEACAIPDGTELVPIAYLGSQVVAGSNYSLLCVKSDAEGSRLAMVTVYDPVSGETPSILNLAELNLAELTIGDASAA